MWAFRTEKNLHGIYYDYEIRIDGETKRTADPYAKACGINGRRSMAVDLSLTNPIGWEEDHAPEQPAERIIYEVHVKEFSWDPGRAVSLRNTGGNIKPFCVRTPP